MDIIEEKKIVENVKNHVLHAQEMEIVNHAKLDSFYIINNVLNHAQVEHSIIQIMQPAKNVINLVKIVMENQVHIVHHVLYQLSLLMENVLMIAQQDHSDKTINANHAIKIVNHVVQKMKTVVHLAMEMKYYSKVNA